MVPQQTLTLLQSLRLFGMVNSLMERLTSPQHADLSHAEFVGLLVQDEQTYRDNQRLTRLLRNAHLRQAATLEDVDYAHPRGLAKSVMLELRTGQWIAAPRNILLSGPTGVGKSFLACALGHLAARRGASVLYARATRLFEHLQQARGDGSHLKALTKLAKVQVLIIDDVLLTPLTEVERKDLLEIVEDRAGRAPTILTSQCPIKEWHRHIGDPTLADALCDRLLHLAYKIELKGESMRKNPRETRPAASRPEEVVRQIQDSL